MEWYGAFGLMVTLVWLYLEFLRLLAKLQSRSTDSLLASCFASGWFHLKLAIQASVFLSTG